MARKSTQAKPRKPYKDFPLFPHATKRWAKKIRGKFHYFGPWDDSDGALQKYLDQKDDLHAGRVPRASGDGQVLRDLVNHFLTAKQRKVEAGELKIKTFGDYHACAARLVDAFGGRRLVDALRADDFGRLRAELAKARGPVSLGNEIQRVRSIFKYGYEAGLLDKPMRFGPEFVKPAQKMVRQARMANGERMLEPAQIGKLLKLASMPMKAMILFGVNCGYGNTDCADLPMSAVDLDAAIVDFPRPKTAIPRRCPLWADTVEALRAAISARPEPQDNADAGLVFITRFGKRWVQGKTDSVGGEFTKLMDKADIECPGRFYTLRHVFRKIADETRDQVAVDRIMGHEDVGRMATHYRERIGDDRLRRVTDHVHAWLFFDD